MTHRERIESLIELFAFRKTPGERTAESLKWALAEIDRLTQEGDEAKGYAKLAFVEGAKWWEFEKTNATMWASDRDLAEAEAARRYPGANWPTHLDRVIKAEHDAIQAVADEREACARVAEKCSLIGETIGPLFDMGWASAQTAIARAIRARGEDKC